MQPQLSLPLSDMGATNYSNHGMGSTNENMGNGMNGVNKSTVNNQSGHNSPTAQRSPTMTSVQHLETAGSINYTPNMSFQYGQQASTLNEGLGLLPIMSQSSLKSSQSWLPGRVVHSFYRSFVGSASAASELTQQGGTGSVISSSHQQHNNVPFTHVHNGQKSIATPTISNGVKESPRPSSPTTTRTITTTTTVYPPTPVYPQSTAYLSGPTNSPSTNIPVNTSLRLSGMQGMIISPRQHQQQQPIHYAPVTPRSVKAHHHPSSYCPEPVITRTAVVQSPGQSHAHSIGYLGDGLTYPPLEVYDDGIRDPVRRAQLNVPHVIICLKTADETEIRLAEYNSSLLYLNPKLRGPEAYKRLPFLISLKGYMPFLPKGTSLPNIFKNSACTSLAPTPRGSSAGVKKNVHSAKSALSNLFSGFWVKSTAARQTRRGFWSCCSLQQREIEAIPEEDEKFKKGETLSSLNLTVSSGSSIFPTDFFAE